MGVAASTAGFWFKSPGGGELDGHRQRSEWGVAPGDSGRDRDRRARRAGHHVGPRSGSGRAGALVALLTVEAQDAPRSRPTSPSPDGDSVGLAGITFYSKATAALRCRRDHRPGDQLRRPSTSRASPEEPASVTAIASFGSDTKGRSSSPRCRPAAALLPPGRLDDLPHPAPALQPDHLVPVVPGRHRTRRHLAQPHLRPLPLRQHLVHPLLAAIDRRGLVTSSGRRPTCPASPSSTFPTCRPPGTTTNTPSPRAAGQQLRAAQHGEHQRDRGRLRLRHCAAGSTTNAELKTRSPAAGACSAVATHSLQVVTIPGLSVTRATGGS